MKENFLIKKFFDQSFKNLNSKKIFYKYNNLVFSYIDLKKFYLKFSNFIESSSNSRKKIAIISEKNFEMYSTVISTILTKNIWIPISPKLPKKRLENILKISKPDILIVNNTEQVKELKIRKFCKVNKIFLTNFNEINKSKIKKNRFFEKKIFYHDTSMIFFTSGSTGDPKGVLINYRGFLNSLFEQKRILYKNKKNLIFGDYHDTSFVISLNILLLCFFSKNTIVPAINSQDTLFPINHFNRNKINVLITVPSTIIRLKNYLKKNLIKNKFEIIIMCGEPFNLNLYSFIREKFISKKIFNCYGSTELSPWVFSHECKKSDLDIFNNFKLVPIGKPFKYTKTLIKNNELLISGKMLSTGYLNKDETEKRFLQINKNIWYKTGDVPIIYKKIFIIKGRKDRIIKIKGYRVDLTEIEKFLNDIKSIKNAVCLVSHKNEETITTVVETNKKVSVDKIILYLRSNIPFYMIPKKFYFMKKFPLNKNGKIDRNKIVNMYK